MRTLLFVALLLLMAPLAHAGTIIVTAGGFSNLGAAPPNWPSAVTWPTGQSPNGSKTFTVSDADFQTILTWTAITQPTVPAAPTPGQILTIWVQQVLVIPTVGGIQKFFTAPVAPPPPISVQ